MSKRRRRHRHRTWVPPGTLVAPPGAEASRVRVLTYDEERLEVVENPSAERLRQLLAAPTTAWIDVVGLGDVAVIETLGGLLGLHQLALEDVLHPGQRPKVERYEGCWFVTLRMHTRPAAEESEQVSLFVGRGWVVTFQEREGDSLESVRARLRQGRRRIRSAGAGYLAYAIVDAIVDAYFPWLERLGDRLDELEAEVLAAARPETLAEIHGVKRQLTQLRRETWSLRDALATLLRDAEETPFEGVEEYLRDCHDHVLRALDMIEVNREIASGLGELYMSALSSRMNEVMRTLTVIATIFIPLSFLAGVYGMNFDFMPELHWRWSYPLLWGVMVAAAGGMLLWFRRRGWLG